MQLTMGAWPCRCGRHSHLLNLGDFPTRQPTDCLAIGCPERPFSRCLWRALLEVQFRQRLEWNKSAEPSSERGMRTTHRWSRSSNPLLRPVLGAAETHRGTPIAHVVPSPIACVQFERPFARFTAAQHLECTPSRALRIAAWRGPIKIFSIPVVDPLGDIHDEISNAVG